MINFCISARSNIATFLLNTYRDPQNEEKIIISTRTLAVAIHLVARGDLVFPAKRSTFLAVAGPSIWNTGLVYAATAALQSGRMETITSLLIVLQLTTK